MRRKWLAVPLLLASVGCGYNRIQQLDEQANGAQGQIEVQLQRRADLIPNLVNTVKGYAQHENDVFTQVTGAKSRNYFNVTTPGAREAPTVDFSRPGATPSPSTGASTGVKKP